MSIAKWESKDKLITGFCFPSEWIEKQKEEEIKYLIKQYNKAIQEERERCAKIAEEYFGPHIPTEDPSPSDYCQLSGQSIAKAIREQE